MWKEFHQLVEEASKPDLIKRLLYVPRNEAVFFPFETLPNSVLDGRVLSCEAKLVVWNYFILLQWVSSGVR